MSLQNFAPVLHQPWKAGNYVNEIVGQKEDGSQYKIEVPAELRDLVISLQNALHTRLDQANELQAQLARVNAIVGDLQ